MCSSTYFISFPKGLQLDLQGVKPLPLPHSFAYINESKAEKLIVPFYKETVSLQFHAFNLVGNPPCLGRMVCAVIMSVEPRLGSKFHDTGLVLISICPESLAEGEASYTPS